MAYRILIVDDDADSREMLAVQLGLHGYHVETAEDGRAALERLAGRSYDALLGRAAMSAAFFSLAYASALWRASGPEKRVL